MPHSTDPDIGLGDLIEKKLSRYFEMNDNYESGANLYECVLAEAEKPLLKIVLQKTHGNQKKAAEILGINRNTLRKKVQLYNISVK